MLDSGSPWVVAHRGDSRFCPENTMSAFRSAMEKGAEMIECDIHLSRDRVPVVIHDSSLDRTTNGSGNIVERDFKELSQLDCGSWFSDQFSGETLPKLEQLLEEASGKILLNLEIKSKAVESEERTDGVESQVCEMVHAFGLEEQVLVSSFHHPCLNRVRKHKYSLLVAPLLERPASFAELKKLNQTCDSFSIHTDEKHVDQQLLREMQESGIPLLCYTVNDPVRMKELSDWGLTGIISDDPGLLKKTIS